MSTPGSVPESDRPRSVTYAVYLIYISTALQILPDPFAFVRGLDLSEGGPLALPCLCAPAIVIVLIAVVFGRAILNRSNVARILFIAMFLLGSVLVVLEIRSWILNPNTLTMLALLSYPGYLVRLVAVVLLVLPASNLWFKKAPRKVASDTSELPIDADASRENERGSELTETIKTEDQSL